MPDIAQPGRPFPADETPNTDTRTYGPASTPTHPLATAPVGAPPFSVDGFVREFLHELNTNQGVTLSRSSVNDQYLLFKYCKRSGQIYCGCSLAYATFLIRNRKNFHQNSRETSAFMPGR